MAHKKAGGSTRNGRDSHSKRLGLKKFGGEVVVAGNIIVRQRGTQFHAGDWRPSNRLLSDASKIIPGDWGKVGPGWLARLLLRGIARFQDGGRIHQFLWRRSRAVSTREKGTERQGTMRNRSEPGQVIQGSFDPE